MSGETPGADRAQQRRRAHLDQRSADKYYRSSAVSALQPPPPTQMAPPAQDRPARRRRLDDRTTDKYYANAPAPLPGPPPPARTQAPPRAALPAAPSLAVNDEDDVGAVVRTVTERLHNGQGPVVVYVKRGASDLLRRTRAAIELLVTRETITEDQYHDVRLSYDQSENAVAALDKAFGPPTPRDHPSDFLEPDEEEVAEAALAQPQDVREADEVKPAEDEDGADFDFLAPGP